jgi:hypothetical protein
MLGIAVKSIKLNIIIEAAEFLFNHYLIVRHSTNKVLSLLAINQAFTLSAATAI